MSNLWWLDKLKHLKELSGLTNEQVAAVSDVPLSTIHKIFAGQTRDPKLETITKIVTGLGYTLDDLKPDAEPDIQDYMAILHSRPEIKLLLHTVKSVTKEEIEQVVQMIQALKRR